MAIDLAKPRPLYLQIVDDIKSKIEKGYYNIGDSIGSQQQLAGEYDVSLITVKKAIAELVNQRILFSRVGKGTYVARKQPVPDFTKMTTIGLVLRDLNTPFFSRIVESVERYSSEKNFNLLLSTSSSREEKEETQIRHFLDIGVSGMIIASMTCQYKATSTIRKLHDDGFPYVMVSYMDDKDINFVGTDHEYGAFLATEHLIKLGYKKIGHINTEKGNILGEMRLSGFAGALSQYNIPCKEEYIYRMPLTENADEYTIGYEIGSRFLRLSDRPQALFVYRDLVALGFQRAVLDGGLKVPEDVAIVGFDNIRRGAVAPVHLTTVHQPTEEIGRIAIQMLSDQIEGKPIRNRVILKPHLVIRDSCGATLRSSGGFMKNTTDSTALL